MEGLRYIQAILLFFCVGNVYFSQLSLSTTVVAMTNAASSNPDFPEFKWSEKEIACIYSSFFWGYGLTQLIGGVASKRYGAKLTIAVAMTGSAICVGIVPIIVMWGGWQALCVARFVMGLLQGTVFPALFHYMIKWTPQEERYSWSALSITGCEFGMFLSYFLAGYIAASRLGWPGVFYISSSSCVVWVILWIIFAADNPTKSKFITKAETDLIASGTKRDSTFDMRIVPVPWLAIFKSIPFLSLLSVRVCGMWSLTTVQWQMPQYLRGVLNMDIKENALYTTLPFMTSWIMSFVYIAAAKIIQKKKWMSDSNIHRTFNSIAYWSSALGIIPIVFLSKEYRTLAIVFMTVGLGANSGGTIGSALNVIDLSPNRWGLLMGIINTVVTVARLISPLFVGVVVSNFANRSEWQIVFCLASFVWFISNFVYIIFGAFEPQPWDTLHYIEPDVL